MSLARSASSLVSMVLIRTCFILKNLIEKIFISSPNKLSEMIVLYTQLVLDNEPDD